MKKTHTSIKILKKVILHAIEIAIFYLIALWIQVVAPENYVWPAIILLGLVYLVYLINSLIDDYLDIKGADFIV
ncbi:hypothetical protein GF369_01030 [Candidatus Peregrinibacteria bacterium]|nr:hypothetical protein [Candidatus Peregrinibacteria bacterium]